MIPLLKWIDAFEKKGPMRSLDLSLLFFTPEGQDLFNQFISLEYGRTVYHAFQQQIPQNRMETKAALAIVSRDLTLALQTRNPKALNQLLKSSSLLKVREAYKDLQLSMNLGIEEDLQLFSNIQYLLTKLLELQVQMTE
jgi:hypothetical protein